MKKINKWIIGVVAIIAVVVVFVVAAQEVKLYLKGENYPFNAIIISGENQSISKAKDVYKDNTKYTKDYKYKVVTQDKSTVVDGKTMTHTEKYLIMTKETAKAMLKDQLFRIKKNDDNSGSLDTNLLTNIPNIDDNQSIILGSNYNKTIQKLNIKGIDIPLKYGNYSWIGYYPQEGTIIITDNDTYKIIDGSEINMSLIRFKKGTMDCKSEKDKAKVNNKLSEVKKIDINYVIVEN